MKEFDIELAKAGHPVCTRDGRRARIICFDCKEILSRKSFPIVALVESDSDTEVVLTYALDGRIAYSGPERNEDLMMFSVHHEGWVNVISSKYDFYYISAIYQSNDDAVAASKEIALTNDKYVTSIKIEWEE